MTSYSYKKNKSSKFCILTILLINQSSTSVDAFAFSATPSSSTKTAFTAPLSPKPLTSFPQSSRSIDSSSLFSSILPINDTSSSSSSSSLNNNDVEKHTSRKSPTDKKDEDIEKLLSMAAKLRAEAAVLEANKAKELADAAENAFRKFDTDQDGEISVAELKAGLSNMLKTELSDARVKHLLNEFDKSGDGVLSLNEFVPLDQFRNRLEILVQEERRLASEAQKKAKEEEEFAKLAETKLALINDREPTGTEKIVSLLPYFLPLMDGLQYGRFLLGDATADNANPLLIGLALVYGIYRTVPLSGFMSFLALNTLSGNPTLNRLIRFNMQQAIGIDIALFIPAFLTGLIGTILNANSISIPEGVLELGADSVFITLVLALTYCAGSSLLGVTPDKLPLISDSIKNRIPTVDMFTVDSDGNLQLKKQEEEDKK